MLDSNIAALVQIVLVGSPGVGRNTLINTLSRNSLRPLEVQRNSPKSGSQIMNYLPRCEFQPQRLSRDVVVQTTNNKGELKQLGFHFTTNPNELPNATCAILMYDITNRESFDELRKIYVPAVKDTLDIDRDLSFCYVVGNKVDLEATSRDVNEGEGRILAQSLGGFFTEVSALKMIHVDIVMRQLRAKVQQLFRKYDASSQPKQLELSHPRVQNSPKKNAFRLGGLQIPMPQRYGSASYTSVDSGVGESSIKLKRGDTGQQSSMNPPELPPRESISLGSAMGDSSFQSLNARQQERKMTQRTEDDAAVLESEQKGIPNITDTNPLSFPFTPGTANFGGKCQSINESDLLFSSKDLMMRDTQGQPVSMMSGFSLIATPVGLQKSGFVSSIQGSPPSFIKELSTPGTGPGVHVNQQYLSPLDSNPEFLHGDRSTVETKIKLVQNQQSPIVAFDLPACRKEVLVYQSNQNTLKSKDAFSNVTFSQQNSIASNKAQMVGYQEQREVRVEQHSNNSLPSFLNIDANDSNFLKKLDKDIQKTEQSLKLMNQRFQSFQSSRQQHHQASNSLTFSAKDNQSSISHTPKKTPEKKIKPKIDSSSLHVKASHLLPLSMERDALTSGVSTGGVATPAFPLGGSKATSMATGPLSNRAGTFISPVKQSYTKRYLEMKQDDSGQKQQPASRKYRLSVASKPRSRSPSTSPNKTASTSCDRYQKKKQAPIVTLNQETTLSGSALLILKIKVGRRKPPVTLHVYHDDSPETLVDRCLFIANLSQKITQGKTQEQVQKIKQRLGEIIQHQINLKVEEMQNLLPEDLLHQILASLNNKAKKSEAPTKSRGSSRCSSRSATIRSSLIRSPEQSRPKHQESRVKQQTVQHRVNKSSPIGQSYIPNYEINPTLLQPIRLSGSSKNLQGFDSHKRSSCTLQTRHTDGTKPHVRSNPSLLDYSPQRFVGRLTIHVGKDKSVDINLHQNEDIQTVAQQFVRENGLRPAVFHTIVKSLEQLVDKDKSRQKVEEKKQQSIQFQRLHNILKDPGKSMSLLQSKSRNAIPDKVSQSLQSLMTTAKFDHPYQSRRSREGLGAGTSREMGSRSPTPVSTSSALNALCISTKARADLKKMLDFRSPSPDPSNHEVLRMNTARSNATDANILENYKYQFASTQESPSRYKERKVTKLESPRQERGAGLLQMTEFLNSVPGSNKSCQSTKKNTVKASQLRKLQNHTVSEMGQANQRFTQQQHSSLISAVNRLKRNYEEEMSGRSTPQPQMNGMRQPLHQPRGRQTPQLSSRRHSRSINAALQRSCGCRTPSPSLGRVSKPPIRFILNFDHPQNGQNRRLVVREGDNLYRLAYNFVITHKLEMKYTKEIWHMLRNSEKFHQQQQENRVPTSRDISPHNEMSLAHYLSPPPENSSPSKK